MREYAYGALAGAIVLALGWLLYGGPFQARQMKILDCAGNRPLTQQVYAECAKESK